MDNRTIIFSEIHAHPDELHKEIMLKIAEYVFQNHHVLELGIADLKDILKPDYADTDIFICMQKLCMLVPPLLELRYEFMHSEDDYEELSQEEIIHVTSKKNIINPRSGESLNYDSYKNSVFLFFKINRSPE